MTAIQRLVGVVVLLLVECAAAASWAEAPTTARPSEAEVRATIDRSLPYLQSAGTSWIEKKKCISCHRVTFLTWSLSAASRNGFEVDRARLQGWMDWSISETLKSRGEGKPVDGAQNLDGVAQLILGQAVDSPTLLSPEQAATFLQLLIEGQQADGSWKPGGQLPGQKRPLSETTQASTMWNALALGRLEKTPAADASRRRAVSWLEQGQPGVSTEWYAVRLLLAHQQGAAERVQKTVEQLRSHQNEDGGWGWLLEDESDALATGQAVYALALAGVPSSDPAITSAQQFLVGTQRKDGAWDVRGTKENKKQRVEETASYWGAAWATLGLLQTLPPPTDAAAG